MHPNTKGALLMVGSMAAFTINDACIKATGGALPLFQLLTIRGVLSSVMIYALARHLGALNLRLPRRDWVLIALRSLGEVGAAYFFLTALMNMPLANVTAILQVLPLTVTVGAALFFGERVGWRRMLAIAVGFSGMVLIVRPGADGFNTYALYTLVAVAFVTLRDLTTRRMSSHVPSMTVTLASALSVLLFSAFASLGVEWVPLNARLIALLLGSSLFIMGGYVLSVAVMRVGEVSFVAPFRYSGLLWGLILGWLVFDEWPDVVTLTGAAIVVMSGLFTLYRERVGSGRQKSA
jgi:S-adenosylmethionine uptake transporter